MSERKGPINGFEHYNLTQIVDMHITGAIDSHRAKDFWRRLFAGDNDPEEMAKGMVSALGYGRYVPRSESKAVVVNITVNGDVPPERIAEAVKGAFAS